MVAEGDLTLGGEHTAQLKKKGKNIDDCHGLIFRGL